MELQLNRRNLDCLKLLTDQVRREEQTQEIKLSDGMPDIGRVLGAWGQILVRGKQWNNSSVQISGGVMAWILYVPEDGTQERCLETWLPFQMKWDIPQTQRDGNICVECALRSIDARSVSARKILVRTSASVMARVYEPTQVQIYSAGEVPEDVQILERNYPVLLPREAGEKVFELEEELRLPPSMPSMEQILYYELHPEIVDQKVMVGKVVFRGTGILHLLYRGEDESINAWDFEIPFSQYCDLDQDFDQEAQAKVTPMVTGLELEISDDALHLRASMAGQYVIYERPMICVVEDAYSIRRAVTPHVETVELSTVLDDVRVLARGEGNLPADCARVLDVSVCFDHPQLRRNGDEVAVDISGNFQTLFYDDEQHLQCAVTRWENHLQRSADQDTHIMTYCQRSGRPQGNMGLGTDVAIEFCSMAGKGMEMVSALELGEQLQPDPERPSLVLRRADGKGLWEMAKNCGSTIADIMQANALTQEPEQGKMLLIPIL